MQDKILDTTNLKNAVSALERSISTYNEFAEMSEKLRETLRSGVIQNFEVAYELCWKFMKKWMQMNIGSDVMEGITRREFYKLAAENGLIKSLDEWMDFHESRNQTSHLYSEVTADEVFDTALTFLPMAQKLVKDME